MWLNYLHYVMSSVLCNVVCNTKKSKNGIYLFYIFIGTGQGCDRLWQVTAGYGGSCGVRGALNRGERVKWVTRLTEVLTCANPKNPARKFADVNVRPLISKCWCCLAWPWRQERYKLNRLPAALGVSKNTQKSSNRCDTHALWP